MKIKKKYKKRIKVISKKTGKSVEDILNELLERGLLEEENKLHVKSIKNMSIYRLSLPNNVLISLLDLGIKNIRDLEKIDNLKDIPGIGIRTEEYIHRQIEELKFMHTKAPNE